MKIRVLYFSSLQDLTGQNDAEEILADDREWTVGELLELLYIRTPSLRDWDGSLLLAVDQKWADREQKLSDGVEVAIMPPVQGG